MFRQLLLVLSLSFLVSSIVESRPEWKNRSKRSSRRLLDVLRNPSRSMDTFENVDRSESMASYFQLMTRIGDQVAKERQRVGYQSLLPFIAASPPSSPVLCQMANICGLLWSLRFAEGAWLCVRALRHNGSEGGDTINNRHFDDAGSSAIWFTSTSGPQKPSLSLDRAMSVVIGSLEFLTCSLLLASICTQSFSQPCDSGNELPCYPRQRRISLVDVLRDPHYVTSMNEEAWEKALSQLKAYQELFGNENLVDPQKKKRSLSRWFVERQLSG